MTKGGRAAAIVLLAGGAVVALAGPANAHAELLDSEPRDGSTLAESPRAVTLRFSEELEPAFTTVAVTGPDGPVAAAGPPQIRAATLVEPLAALTNPGRYTVAFRAVSVDGHATAGTVSFVLAAPAAAPGASTSPPASPPASPPGREAADPSADGSRGTTSPRTVLLAAAGLAAIGAGALAVRRSVRRG